MTVLDGRYRLIAPLARGGMSTVWRGHDEVLARPVAVKVIDREVAADTTFMERVRREATAVARLTHPHIATVYDYGESESVQYIVMELVDGETLAQVLGRGPLTWPTAVGICAQVAAALAAAHAGGVVHRDITPSNVMLAADGVKVIDFGIAASAGSGDVAGARVFGTPAYLAPERLTGGLVQPATDVYGLGLLLYEALTGCLPWPASTVTQMLSARCHQAPSPLPPIVGMPVEVADLCHACLYVDPALRPSSVRVVRELVSLARRGDRRRVAGAAPSSPPWLLPCAVSPLLSASLPSSSAPSPLLSAAPSPSSTRVMPHGMLEMPDTGRSTEPIGPEASRRHVFLLPTVLLAILLGCLGIAQLRPGTSGARGGAAPGTFDGKSPGAAQPGAAQPGAARPGAGRGGAAPIGPAWPARPAMACRVRVEVMPEWIFGFTAQLTIDNIGQAAVTGWTLKFTLPDGLRVGGGWNGRWQQRGEAVTVGDVIYNRSVSPGGHGPGVVPVWGFGPC